MNGTIYMPVGEVCSSISDTYREKKNMVTLINTSDVLEGRVLNHERVPNSNLKGQFKKTFQRDDILYSEIRPQNRRFAYVDFSPIDYIASTKLMVIRAKKDVVSPKYLYYFLKNSSTVAELQLLAETRSGTFPQITFSEVANLTIPVPSLAVQEVIVQTMQCLEDKITCNEQINDNLMQQAVTIFKSWFVEYSPFDGIEPKEWETVNLEKITSLINRGIAPKYSDNSDQIVINQKCIRNHMIDLSQARTHTPKVINEKWLRFGDLLINSTGDGTLGRAAQVWFQPQNITVDSHVTVVRPAKENLIFYIGLWGVLHEREIESLHTGSTGQTELPKERVKALELHLPDNGTLDRFNTLIAPMAAAIVSKQNENNKLATLRDALLPKLMSGEIDVSAVQL
jgi:type I restriction enzyme S subunit